MKNPLMETLKEAIEAAKAKTIECPRCLKVITTNQTIVMWGPVIYHAGCRPLDKGTKS